MGGSLTDDFQPFAACKFLDLPPGLVSPFLRKTVHWTDFRALEPSKPAKSAGATDGSAAKLPAKIHSPIDRLNSAVYHMRLRETTGGNFRDWG